MEDANEVELDEAFDYLTSKRMYLQCHGCRRQYLVYLTINPYNEMYVDYDPSYCPCCGGKVVKVNSDKSRCYV